MFFLDDVVSCIVSNLTTFPKTNISRLRWFIWKWRDIRKVTTIRWEILCAFFWRKKKLKTHDFQGFRQFFSCETFHAFFERNGDSIHDAFKEVRSVGGIMLQVWWVSGCRCDSIALWVGGKGCHLNWGVNRIRFPPVASVEAGLRVIFVLSRWWQLK